MNFPQRFIRVVATGAVLACAVSAPAQGREMPTASNFALHELSSGRLLQLSDWKGKVVLVSFLATSCAHSQRAFPLLDRLHREFASQDVVILGVIVDSGPEEEVRKFLAGQALAYRSPTAYISM